jgi:hypothetical protein
MFNLFSQMQGALMNPVQFLMSKGFPQDSLQNPEQTVQNLLNSGRMSQEQFNQFSEMSKQLQNMPQFRQMFR